MVEFALAKEVLENHPEEEMTGHQIWDYAQKNGLSEKLNSKGKTPWTSVSALIYQDLKHNQASNFKQDNPAKFKLQIYPLKKKTASQTQASGSRTKKPEMAEKDLYDKISEYTINNLAAHSKKINHTVSEKGEKGAMTWTHPDVVAARFLFEDTNIEVYKDILKKMIHPEDRITFYSFEVKTEISMAKLKEYFFQAVSNSSWAHEGYLVIGSKITNKSIIEDLERLSAAFGIGVIVLDTTNPNASEILFPARRKERVDLYFIDKLAQSNKEFRAFFNSCLNASDTMEINRENFDNPIEQRAPSERNPIKTKTSISPKKHPRRKPQKKRRANQS